MADFEFSIHWLSFTVHASEREARTLYTHLFGGLFGPLMEKPGGLRRQYRDLYFSNFAFKIYANPANEFQEHCHIEIPGEACEHIPPEKYIALLNYLQVVHKEAFAFKRLDLAFDKAAFTPEDVHDAILNWEVRTLAKRQSYKFHGSPFELRDDGEKGTFTSELGSEESQRKITAYNKRGFTRLEFQCKDVRANLIAVELFSAREIGDWPAIGVKHLRDYIDFNTPWWEEFVSGVGRAKATVSEPRTISVEKRRAWIERQVGPSLSIVNDVFGSEEVDRIIDQGRERRNRNDEFLVGWEGEDENENPA